MSPTTDPNNSNNVFFSSSGLYLDDDDSPHYSNKSHAEQLLYRSLNIRRTIAFIGSGVSRAYKQDSWKELADKLVNETIKYAKEHNIKPHNILTNFIDEDKPGNSLPTAERIPIVLSLCEQTLQKSTNNNLHEIAKKILSASPPNINTQHHPLRIVMEELGIRRFVTTNYDISIEESFREVLGYECHFDGNPELNTNEKNKEELYRKIESFNFNPKQPEKLLQFAVGAPGYRQGVFHLHGVYNLPETMILTEKDYQSLYLKDSSAYQSYRDALKLLFYSNPILFIGSSMTEGDILQPMRYFLTEREHEIRKRPLFAILPGEEPNQTEEYRHFLLDKYGVMAFFYDANQSASADGTVNKSAGLCTALKEYARNWHTWWRDFQGKPSARQANYGQQKINNSSVMMHHALELPQNNIDVNDKVNEIIKKIADNKSNVIIVIGHAGTGKGSLGIKLVENTGENPDLNNYTKRFFATTHFTNEFNSIIDAASEFFNGKIQNLTKDSLIQLQSSLCQESMENSAKKLFVIGGLERLLKPISPLKISDKAYRLPDSFDHRVQLGEAKNLDVLRFFNMIKFIAKSTADNCIVLTTSVWPIELLNEPEDIYNNMEPCQGIDPIHYQGVTQKHLLSIGSYSKLKNETIVSEFCSVIHGHLYVTIIVSHALETIDNHTEAESWLTNLTDRLRFIEFQNRAELAVVEAMKIILQKLNLSKSDNHFSYQGLIDRVAVLGIPVEAKVISACYSHKFYIKENDKAPKIDEIEAALRVLESKNLLLKVKAMEQNQGGSFTNVRGERYTAHSILRSYALHRLGTIPDSVKHPHSFDLTDYANETSEARITTIEGYKFATSMFDNILSHINENTQNNNNQKERLWLSRAAFGLLRSHWTATGIGRLVDIDLEILNIHNSHYDTYYKRLCHLIDNLRQHSTNWIDSDQNKHLSDSGILYIDELLWLYNEMGMVAYCQGVLDDAYAIFRLCHDIVKSAAGSSYRVCQSELNLAQVQLDRAHLSRARDHANNVLSLAMSEKYSDIASRAKGLLGLINHLSGNYKQADTLYEKALDGMSGADNKNINYRGISIYSRHKADLHRLRGQIDEADRCIQESIAAAEAGRHIDLLNFARVAQINNDNNKENELPAQESLQFILKFAQKTGMPKLTAEVFRVQGLLALRRGDYQTAQQKALHALSITSTFGMRLRMIAALVLLGQVKKHRCQFEKAHTILRSAADYAEIYGYQLQQEVAERECMTMQFS